MKKSDGKDSSTKQFLRQHPTRGPCSTWGSQPACLPQAVMYLVGNNKQGSAALSVLQGCVLKSVNLNLSERTTCQFPWRGFFKKQQWSLKSPTLSREEKEWLFSHHITWMETVSKNNRKMFLCASVPAGGQGGAHISVQLCCVSCSTEHPWELTSPRAPKPTLPVLVLAEQCYPSAVEMPFCEHKQMLLRSFLSCCLVMCLVVTVTAVSELWMMLCFPW